MVLVKVPFWPNYLPGSLDPYASKIRARLMLMNCDGGVASQVDARSSYLLIYGILHPAPLNLREFIKYAGAAAPLRECRAASSDCCGILWVLRRMPLVLGGKWDFLLCPIPTPGGCTLCCVAGLAEWLYLGMPPTPIHRNISWTIRAPLQIFHFICVRAVTYDDECKCCTFRTFRQFCSLAGGISRLKVADPFAQFSATCWRPLSRYNAGELTSPFSEQLRQQLNGSKPLAFIPWLPFRPAYQIR